MEHNKEKKRVVRNLVVKNRPTDKRFISHKSRKVFSSVRDVKRLKRKLKRLSASGKVLKIHKRNAVFTKDTIRKENFEVLDDGTLILMDDDDDNDSIPASNQKDEEDRLEVDEQNNVETTHDENNVNSPIDFEESLGYDDEADCDNPMRVSKPTTEAKKAFLFEKCFKIVEIKNTALTTKCQLCEKAGRSHKFVKGSDKCFSNFKTHLQVTYFFAFHICTCKLISKRIV